MPDKPLLHRTVLYGNAVFFVLAALATAWRFPSLTGGLYLLFGGINLLLTLNGWLVGSRRAGRAFLLRGGLYLLMGSSVCSLFPLRMH
ncbi:MAG TPA: hypothetical protein VHK69_12755 [Chitinophagaceae bacterium]|jgi:hypothetical protein|nr:hypothetical protein [Chitinophagaceae bacterium]